MSVCLSGTSTRVGAVLGDGGSGLASSSSSTSVTLLSVESKWSVSPFTVKYTQKGSLKVPRCTNSEAFYLKCCSLLYYLSLFSEKKHPFAPLPGSRGLWWAQSYGGNALRSHLWTTQKACTWGQMVHAHMGKGRVHPWGVPLCTPGGSAGALAPALLPGHLWDHFTIMMSNSYLWAAFQNDPSHYLHYYCWLILFKCILILFLPHCQTTVCCHSQHYWSQNPGNRFDLGTIPALSDYKTNADNRHKSQFLHYSRVFSELLQKPPVPPPCLCTHRYIPCAKSSGPKVFLQLLLVSLAGLHVKILEDVVFALGADLSRGHLQRVVVQRNALEMTQVSVTQGHMGNAIAGYIQPNKGQFRYFWNTKCGMSLFSSCHCVLSFHFMDLIFSSL